MKCKKNLLSLIMVASIATGLMIPTNTKANAAPYVLGAAGAVAGMWLFSGVSEALKKWREGYAKTVVEASIPLTFCAFGALAGYVAGTGHFPPLPSFSTAATMPVATNTAVVTTNGFSSYSMALGAAVGSAACYAIQKRWPR
ncbi:MAG TPA: hypothetical protein VFF04_02280 [Candidatus Babeliales bacterium]|nr:hypothetical protein [Candidatus Babeliales bacterium]